MMKVPRNSERLIELKDVTVRYDRRDVIRNVNFTLYKGDFVAISGPNGGGKTTLLRTLLKLLKPTEGTVEYFRNDRRVSYLPIGYLPQKNNIDTRFPITVSRAVRSGQIRGLFGRLPEGADERFAEVVKLCGISDYLDRNIGNLSGGQLQRTLLARAIVLRPEIIVLDEPLSYVDKNFERQIYSIMERLAETTTIVLVSHEMSVISGMANRHVIVDGGQIHLCHSKTHFLESPCY